MGYEARLLAQDERLRKLRFRLVPRRVKEKTFWRQFFQQVAAGLVAHFPPVARVGAPAAAAAAAAAGPSKKLLEPWRKLSSQVVLERKPWLVVEEHKVGLPGGKEIPGWTFIRSRDFVNVAVAARRPEVAEVKGAGDLQWCVAAAAVAAQDGAARRAPNLASLVRLTRWRAQGLAAPAQVRRVRGARRGRGGLAGGRLH